jgi:acetyltransferase-like isoleucine patch superfamily enzyme
MLFDVKKLKKLGKNVMIGELVKIINPEMVEIDDNSRIEDFSLIVGGNGVRLGKFVHIASFCSVIGSGEFIMEDFSAISAGCRIITGTDDYTGKCVTNPCTPIRYRTHAMKGKVVIGKHAALATSTIVYPNITIGEGAATGAGSIININLDPWGIYLGSPPRKCKDRESEVILRMEREIIKEFYG